MTRMLLHNFSVCSFWSSHIWWLLQFLYLQGQMKRCKFRYGRIKTTCVGDHFHVTLFHLKVTKNMFLKIFSMVVPISKTKAGYKYIAISLHFTAFKIWDSLRRIIAFEASYLAELLGRESGKFQGSSDQYRSDLNRIRTKNSKILNQFGLFSNDRAGLKRPIQLMK